MLIVPLRQILSSVFLYFAIPETIFQEGDILVGVRSRRVKVDMPDLLRHIFKPDPLALRLGNKVMPERMRMYSRADTCPHRPSFNDNIQNVSLSVRKNTLLIVKMLDGKVFAQCLRRGPAEQTDPLMAAFAFFDIDRRLLKINVAISQ